MATGLSDGAAHHDEIAYNGELYIMVRRGDDFYTTHSTTPKTGGWSTEVGIGSAGGLAHFFLEGGTLYAAVLKSPAPRMNQIFEYNSGTDSWSLVDEASSTGWDPTLFKVGSTYVFVQAPWTSEGGGRQYNIAWTGTSLSTLLSGGTSVAVTEGRYGTNTWVDMWPIGFTDNGGTGYLFFTSERNASDPGNEGTGNIWYLEYDWDATRDHYTYIQEAVDAAGVGDDINIAAGTYEEQVVVTTDDVGLYGYGSGSDPASNTIIKSPASLTYNFDSGGNFNYPIVGFDGVSGVAIEDCRVDGAGRGNANSRFCGIAFWNAGGGVADCHLTGVRDTPFSGAQHGIAIYAYNNISGTYSLSITDTDLDDFQKGGMVLSGDGLTVTVDGCTVTGQGHTGVTAQNGIQIGFGAGGDVIDCSVSDIGWTGGSWVASGILLLEGSTVDISGATTVTNSQASVIYQETQGAVTDLTVSSGAIVSVEGVSVRDYGYAMLSGEGMQPVPVSPFEEDYTPGVLALGGAATSVTIAGATFTGQHHGGDYGIAVWAMGDDVSATITDCSIEDYEYGIVAYEDVSSVAVTANDNNISSNDAGFWSNAAVTQDAESNYWGDASGPYNATTNTDGTGDEVDGPVDYSPWWGDDYVGDSHTSPWTWYTNDSIQDAVDAATAGDYVYVKTGTYPENVLVDKALTLSAASTPEVTPASGPGIDIEASGVTVQGFTIHGCETGIQVYLPASEYGTSFGYTDLKLLDNTIYDISSGSWGFGMYLGTESERYNSGHGMYDPSLTDLLDFSGLEIAGNEIYGTSGASIVLQSMRPHTGGPILVDSNNIHDSAQSGLWIDGAWDINVTGNQLTGNANGVFLSNYGDGYYEGTPDTAYDPKNILIAGNQVHGNTSVGFNLWDGYPGLIDFEYNSIVGNTMGLDNHLSVNTDGTMNWWGDASGPSGSGPGSGDPVSPFAFYDPWIGGPGGGNIVCAPDPLELTTAQPVKTVDIDYLGGGGGLMYGYSVKFSWDGAVASTAVSKVTQGSLLSDQG
ncbi:MAG: right-handed parallel beta-helix repeat-containing protein, partial [bacterium]